MIVRLHEDIETKYGKKVVWEKGTVLEKEACRALIVEDEHPDDGRKLIRISIQGKKGENRKHVLRDIRNELEGIHKRSFSGLKVLCKISCICEACRIAEKSYEYDLEDLKRFQQRNISTAQCMISGKHVNVILLLDKIFTGFERHEVNFYNKQITDQKKKVFFSYSKADREYLDEFKNHLSSLVRQEKIEPWDDYDILPGKEWDDKIKKELKEADIILLLISSDFLKTDYIWNVEIPIIKEQYEQRGVMVVPIIIRKCDWEEIPFISDLNALPAKGKTVKKGFEDRDTAWFEVVKGIKKLLNKNE